VYAALLLPSTDIETLKNRLGPLLTAQNLQQKVEKSSGGKMQMMRDMEKEKPNSKQRLNDKKSNNAMLAQVVGLIIGSPEFQRR